jgi:hypothetical protein
VRIGDKDLGFSSQITADKGYDNYGCSFLDRLCDKKATADQPPAPAVRWDCCAER